MAGQGDKRAAERTGPVAHEVSRGPEGSWASVGASTVVAVCIFEPIYVYYAVFLFFYIYLGKYLYIQFFAKNNGYSAEYLCYMLGPPLLGSLAAVQLVQRS